MENSHFSQQVDAEVMFLGMAAVPVAVTLLLCPYTLALSAWGPLPSLLGNSFISLS